MAADEKSTLTDLVIQLKRACRSSTASLLDSNSALCSKTVDVREDKLAASGVEELYGLGKELYDAEVMRHLADSRKHKPGEAHWRNVISERGTFSDKTASLMLAIQESPALSLGAVEKLVVLLKAEKQREIVTLLDTVRDVFISVLPKNRKLLPLDYCPVESILTAASGNNVTSSKLFLRYYVEGSLKNHYTVFLDYLTGSLMHHVMPLIKSKAILTCLALLMEVPEGEARVLTALVNKLGDPDYKVSSKVCHTLHQLLNKHPAMKSVVTEAIEQLIFRPNVSPNARFYGVVSLHNLQLTMSDQKLVERLISIYIAIFQSLVESRSLEESSSAKLLSHILSGCQRTVPFAKKDSELLMKHINVIYKIVHTTQFNVSVQALQLIYQLDSSSSRFYNVLYEKLLDPALQISKYQGLFLNLLFKALKSDHVTSRLRAFAKRILQVASSSNAEFLAGCLILVSELTKTKAGILQPVTPFQSTITDEEEEKPEEPEPDVLSSWHHAQKPSDDNKNFEVKSAYDYTARNPEGAGADCCEVWEMALAAHHFHPSIQVFANTLLGGKKVNYDGDPFIDFTRMRFLDKFAYKNPKQIDGKAKKNPFARYQLPNAARDSEDFLTTYQQLCEKVKEGKLTRKQRKANIDEESIGDDDFDDYLFQHEAEWADEELKLGDLGERRQGQVPGVTRPGSDDELSGLDMDSDEDDGFQRPDPGSDSLSEDDDAGEELTAELERGVAALAAQKGDKKKNAWKVAKRAGKVLTKTAKVAKKSGKTSSAGKKGKKSSSSASKKVGGKRKKIGENFTDGGKKKSRLH